jgi:hypothetical protein
LHIDKRQPGYQPFTARHVDYLFQVVSFKFPAHIPCHLHIVANVPNTVDRINRLPLSASYCYVSTALSTALSLALFNYFEDRPSMLLTQSTPYRETSLLHVASDKGRSAITSPFYKA